MLRRILLALLLLVALFVAVGLCLSRDYEVARTIRVQGDVARVHALVGDLAAWPKWAPWHDVDKTLQTELGNTTTGVGASQSWGTKDGRGRLVITRSDPRTGVAFDIVFVNGARETPAWSTIDYLERDGGVDVTWTMRGAVDMPVFAGWFAALSDTMIGPMFEAGLRKLKAAAEGA